MARFVAATLLILSAFARAEEAYEEEERALIIAMKDLKEFPVVVGKEFEVVYSIHNVGQVAALDVEIVDDWPESLFERVKGEPGATFDKIEAGASETYTFTLKPLAPNPQGFLALHADVEYSWMEFIEEDDEEEIVSTESKTSFIGRFPILTEAEYLRQTSHNAREWGLFLGVQALVVVGPYLRWSAEKARRR
jgi:hypothetical protein